MGTVLVITGPTATGKSKLAMELAGRFNGEIINADSMQVYRGMDIGTAKPSIAVRAGIPHHLYDICDVSQRFSAGDYITRAVAVIHDILKRNRLPIVVGGSGLYLRALLTGFFDEPRLDLTVETSLNRSIDRAGSRYLFRMLEHVDPDFAARISPNDRQRIIRGLTVYFSCGQSLSSLWEHVERPLPDIRFLIIGLRADREKLYREIEERVEEMMAAGLLDEVKRLYRKTGSAAYHAFKAIGYRELMGVVAGDLSLDAAVDMIKQNTRRFAKRQLTWFRDEPIRWFDVDLDAGQIPVEEISNFITMKMNDHNKEQTDGNQADSD